MGTGTCVFSPKLKSVIPFDSMLLMIAELGGVSLERSKRWRAAPLKPADTSSVTSIAIIGFWCRIIFGFKNACRHLQKAAGVVFGNHEGLRRSAQDLSRRVLIPSLGVTPHVMKGESYAISLQKLGPKLTLAVACKSIRKVRYTPPQAGTALRWAAELTFYTTVDASMLRSGPYACWAQPSSADQSPNSCAASVAIILRIVRFTICVVESIMRGRLGLMPSRPFAFLYDVMPRLTYHLLMTALRD